MEITDIAILVIVGVFAVKGLFKGLINEVFGLMGLILGYVLSFQFYIPLSKVFLFMGFSNSVSEGVGFVVSFLLIYIIIFLTGKVLSKFFKSIQLGWADKTGGFAFGAFKSAVIIGLILSFLISVIPPNSQFNRSINSSVVSGKLVKITPYVFDLLNKLPKTKRNNPFH